MSKEYSTVGCDEIKNDVQNKAIGAAVYTTDITFPDNGMTPTNEINQLTIDEDYIAEHKAEIQEKFQEIAMNYAQ